ESRSTTCSASNVSFSAVPSFVVFKGRTAAVTLSSSSMTLAGHQRSSPLSNTWLCRNSKTFIPWNPCYLAATDSVHRYSDESVQATSGAPSSQPHRLAVLAGQYLAAERVATLRQSARCRRHHCLPVAQQSAHRSSADKHPPEFQHPATHRADRAGS